MSNGRWTQYDAMAQHNLPAALRLIQELGNGPGMLLDLGSGTGTAVDGCKDASWEPVGLDLSAQQLSQAASQGHPLVRADAEQLPFPDNAFATVLSNFGLIFAQHPQRVFIESRRCLRRGGRIGLTAWIPGGWPGACRDILARHADRAPSTFPVALGVEPAVRVALASAGFGAIVVKADSLAWNFANIDDAVDQLTTAAGGLRMLRAVADQMGTWPAARQELHAELASRCSPQNAGFRLTDEYLQIVAET